jgi:hypothetical protein
MAKTYRLGSLPNGCVLYVRENEAGGRSYYSDEIGGVPQLIWDTCLIDKSTLLATILEEEKINIFSEKKGKLNNIIDDYIKFKRSEG